ncbi:MAG TPA: DUF4178 domain-containing protein [Bacteroidia bacterium]|nr:DUF4178 domain-containing protein [Bacteroidia bacterium]
MNKNLSEIKRKLALLNPDLKSQSNNILDIIKNKSGYIEIKRVLYKIEAVHRYETKNEHWHEVVLTNLETLSTSYLELYVDDVLEMSICHESEKVTPAKVGINMDKVEEISENEDGSVLFYGERFYYDDDYKIKFIKKSNEEAIKFYTYEFESLDGKLLSIDEWDEGDGQYSYELFVSEIIEQTEINLI